MDALLPFAAAILGFFTGTLLVSRVGSWVQVLVNDRHPVVFILHSGPWLLAATIYAAYYSLAPSARPRCCGFPFWFLSLVERGHHEKGSKDQPVPLVR